MFFLTGLVLRTRGSLLWLAYIAVSSIDTGSSYKTCPSNMNLSSAIASKVSRKGPESSASIISGVENTDISSVTASIVLAAVELLDVVREFVLETSQLITFIDTELRVRRMPVFPYPFRKRHLSNTNQRDKKMRRPI